MCLNDVRSLSGLAAHAMEVHLDVVARVGADHRRGGARLGRFHDHHRPAQVHERRVTLFDHGSEWLDITRSRPQYRRYSRDSLTSCCVIFNARRFFRRTVSCRRCRSSRSGSRRFRPASWPTVSSPNEC